MLRKYTHSHTHTHTHAPPWKEGDLHYSLVPPWLTVRVLMSWPSGIDQSMMVLSLEPDARTLPSGLNDTVITYLLWPCMRGVLVMSRSLRTLDLLAPRS